MAEPSFQLCRNPRCRSRMASAFSRHAQFCAKGCWQQFHRKRCVVCEKEFERKAGNQLVCGKRKCRAELTRQPEIYRPFHCGPMARIGAKAPESCTATDCCKDPLGSADETGTFFRALPDRVPFTPGLKGWRWSHMGREDQDWQLFARDGRLAARIRQEGAGWWVARPRVDPEPPIDPNLTRAMRRAEVYALWALPCRMPVRPVRQPPVEHGCYSPLALAARAPSPRPSGQVWDDGLDIPDCLRRAPLPVPALAGEAV